MARFRPRMRTAPHELGALAALVITVHMTRLLAHATAGGHIQRELFLRLISATGAMYGTLCSASSHRGAHDMTKAHLLRIC
jgi:hypothetical protein